MIYHYFPYSKIHFSSRFKISNWVVSYIWCHLWISVKNYETYCIVEKKSKENLYVDNNGHGTMNTDVATKEIGGIFICLSIVWNFIKCDSEGMWSIWWGLGDWKYHSFNVNLYPALKWFYLSYSEHCAKRVGVVSLALLNVWLWLFKKCCIIDVLGGTEFDILTLILLTWRIWWAPNNARRWQMGFNSAFKGLRDNSDLNCTDLSGDLEDVDMKCHPTGRTSEEAND
jgi:hypothetical protein